MAKILIVEDERKIARFVELELKHEGYEVDWAENGIDALDKILTTTPDLVILDVMLPGMSGIDVCRKAREGGYENSIIMLTAKDDIMDKVEGLDNGADDYMTKPFAIEELLARIRVAHGRQQKMVKEPKKVVLEHGMLKVDTAMHEVHYGEDLISLTKKEYDLLVYLLNHLNEAVSRETILEEVWDYDYMGETNVVDVYVRYIRQKLDDKYGVKILNTVRGVGYIIKDE
ncbi:MAG: response regulator transcription factor [Lachnospiraceae bacterium]|jgi:DNA-binding response OmpR family regulator|nr:response regulator transcription factor [Lachnospiraceae bacterium]MBQ5561430.1 response regulator transcription factor [Lachnospiraceae bacterium]MCR4803813.1 response regulator transcription factor [Lachnospiraceae bacterium]